jgi:penicillin-binding protein 2
MEHLSGRKYIIGIIIILIGLVFIIRLFFLQVVDTSYRVSAENNSRRVVTLFPARGLIYDRNGELMVYNQAAYDLMISPFQLKAFDTTELISILDITKQRLIDGIEKAYHPRTRREPFIKQLSPESYAVLQEKLYKFPGFYVQPRTLRKYSRNIAAHVLGYVGEVDDKKIAEDEYYNMGDYIGISGVEKTYEQYLRGEKGRNIYNVDVHGRVQGPYEDGKFNEPAVVGKNLVSSIDSDLQEYGEKLMDNFRGSIVAIEPSTGEILALISAPDYSPDLLVGRVRTKNYVRLLQDTLKPLFNRALMAQYPPGSTFKLVNALIGLEEDCLTNSTKYYCDLGYYYGGVHVGCHTHSSPLNLPQAIQKSCNAYFCNVFRRIIQDPKFANSALALDNWRNKVMSFGFGKKLESDFANELSGSVPGSSLYNNIYGENRWKFITVISLSIGQGELAITPLQMANMTSAIANKGYYYRPHVIKSIVGADEIDPRFSEKQYTAFDTSYFPVVIEGMEQAVNGGAGSTARIAQIPGITVCGKTGTAENPHGEDHSIFVAFAPKEKPRIAVSVYIENGGFGSTYAAPVASLMIEKYLTDTISYRRKWIEQRMLNANIDYQEDE